MLGIVVVLMSSGCATIASKSQWPVTINSTPSGATVTVKDQKGVEVYKNTTPVTVTMRAGAGFFKPAKYTFQFEKEGYFQDSTSLSADVNGWFFGNILWPAGLFFDAASGAMWKLAGRVQATLKEDPQFTDWQVTQATDTIAAYETFVQKYPQGKYTQEASKRIEELPDWHTARSVNTVAAYEVFLQKYPEGTFAQDAHKQIVELEWQVTQTKNTSIAYETFLQKYPEGEFSEDAFNRLVKLSPFKMGEVTGILVDQNETPLIGWDVSALQYQGKNPDGTIRVAHLMINEKFLTEKTNSSGLFSIK